jgi:hypothetical protein
MRERFLIVSLHEKTINGSPAGQSNRPVIGGILVDRRYLHKVADHVKRRLSSEHVSLLF